MFPLKVLDYMRGGDLMQHQDGDPKTYSCKPMGSALLLRVLSQVRLIRRNHTGR